MQTTTTPQLLDLRVTHRLPVGVRGMLDGAYPFNALQLTDSVRFGRFAEHGMALESSVNELIRGNDAPGHLYSVRHKVPSPEQRTAIRQVLEAVDALAASRPEQALPLSEIGRPLLRNGQVVVERDFDGEDVDAAPTGFLFERDDPAVQPLLDALRGLREASGFRMHTRW